MFNPVIIGALVVQAIVRNISKIAGAMFGYIITTGILIWGLSVYAEGNIITWFSIPLSKQIFLYAVFAWYWLDTNELRSALKENNKIIDERLPKEIECPQCGEKLELEEAERIERKFTCVECNNLIDLSLEKNEKSQTDKLDSEIDYIPQQNV
jgi:transcription elongation factor Elf1